MNAANKKVRHFPPISQIYWHVKKTPRIYGIYPVTNREIRFLVIFYEYLPDVYMHPTMKLFNTVHQLIFVCENFCEVRESLVFVNACISHRDLVFKCLSLVFSLWIGWFLSIIEVKIIEKPSTLYFPTFHQSHFACFSFTWPSQIGRIFIPVVFKQTFLSRTF